MSDTATLLLAKEGNDAAMEKIILQNQGLVWSIVRRFLGRGVDADDLYQLGCMGLIKAARGFEASLGNKFSTYAVPKIAGEIRRFLRDDGTVKVSRALKERNRKIKLAESELSLTLGRDPTVSELAVKLGLSPEEIAEAEFATGSAESLSWETDEGTPLEAMLGNDGIEEQVLEHVALKDALNKLPERDRTILSLRFFRGLTQEKCAKILNLSQVQVSRIERSALKKLREII